MNSGVDWVRRDGRRNLRQSYDCKIRRLYLRHGRSPASLSRKSISSASYLPLKSHKMSSLCHCRLVQNLIHFFPDNSPATLSLQFKAMDDLVQVRLEDSMVDIHLDLMEIIGLSSNCLVKKLRG